jgi:6-phosphogluconolactonase
MFSTLKVMGCIALSGVAFASQTFAGLADVSEKETLVYIGTYTGAKSRGIYVSRFSPRDGTLTTPEFAAEAESPSFLVMHPTKPLLFCVEESARIGVNHEGAVSAFRVAPLTGKLSSLGRQASGGTGPCHLALTSDGQCLLEANYGSGTIATFEIGREGGLSEPRSIIQHRGSSMNPERQAGPHAHFISPDPRGRFVLACDLGLDKVLLYERDKGKCDLRPHVPNSGSTVQAGSGPRHLAFHPSGKWLYVVNEMGCTVTVFSYDAKNGAMKEIQTIGTLPQSYHGSSSCAEIQAHPNGKFVYASNRGHDSIAVFTVDSNGKLAIVENCPTGGKTPRHFALDPTGQWLFAENQDSDSILSFQVDTQSGSLKSTGKAVQVGSPVCMVFVPNYK